MSEDCIQKTRRILHLNIRQKKIFLISSKNDIYRLTFCHQILHTILYIFPRIFQCFANDLTPNLNQFYIITQTFQQLTQLFFRIKFTSDISNINE